MNKKVLFVCIHNSARSQMAEAFLNKLSNGQYLAESAGLEQGKLNPIVVKAMQEIGYDISKNESNAVQQFLDEKREYDLLITVCDESNAEACPIFPGKGKRLHWGFEDPSGLGGSDDDKLKNTRIIRDVIKIKIEEFLG